MQPLARQPPSANPQELDRAFFGRTVKPWSSSRLGQASQGRPHRLMPAIIGAQSCPVLTLVLRTVVRDNGRPECWEASSVLDFEYVMLSEKDGTCFTLRVLNWFVLSERF